MQRFADVNVIGDGPCGTVYIERMPDWMLFDYLSGCGYAIDYHKFGVIRCGGYLWKRPEVLQYA